MEFINLKPPFACAKVCSWCCKRSYIFTRAPPPAPPWGAPGWGCFRINTKIIPKTFSVLCARGARCFRIR